MDADDAVWLWPRINSPAGDASQLDWYYQRPQPGWVAAFRVMNRNGSPVVAELRLFPDGAESGSASVAPLQLGEWSGDLAQVPPNGLGTSVVRAVRLSDARESVRAAWAELAESGEIGAAMAGLSQRQVGQRVKHPGRGGRDPRWFAAVAYDYSRLVDAGTPKPAAHLAKAYSDEGHKYEETTVRGWIHEARQRGLLTDAPSRGVAGGTVTPLGLALLGGLVPDAEQPPLPEATRQRMEAQQGMNDALRSSEPAAVEPAAEEDDRG